MKWFLSLGYLHVCCISNTHFDAYIYSIVLKIKAEPRLSYFFNIFDGDLELIKLLLV